MEIEFDTAKERVSNLIDMWSYEVITDLLKEISVAADQRNITDIELTLECIRDVQKQAFEIKQKITKSNTTQQIFSILNCELFTDVEETILGNFLDIEVKIKKNNSKI
jgi:cell wall assembly regulator SMI1